MIRMGNAPDNQFEIMNALNNLIWQQLDKVICITDGTTETSIQSEAFTIYPNPANTEINIITRSSSKEFKTLLVDMHGQLVTSANNCKCLNVSGISPGAYILVLFQNGKRFMYTISIVR